jgi:hypothetical protein
MHVQIYLTQISSITTSNDYLHTYIIHHNKHFTSSLVTPVKLRPPLLMAIVDDDDDDDEDDDEELMTWLLEDVGWMGTLNDESGLSFSSM